MFTIIHKENYYRKLKRVYPSPAFRKITSRPLLFDTLEEAGHIFRNCPHPDKYEIRKVIYKIGDAVEKEL